MAYTKIGEITVPTTTSDFYITAVVTNPETFTVKIVATDSDVAAPITNGSYVFDSTNDTFALSVFPSAATYYVYGEATNVNALTEFMEYSTLWTGAFTLSLYPNLLTLDLLSNAITGITLTGNTSLQTLNVSDTGLTSIDVSTNTALNTLNISSTSISALDVSNNVALVSLNISSTEIVTADVSGLSLTALTVSPNTYLTNLNCSDNSLTNVGLTNTIVEVLDISDNAVTTLSLGTIAGSLISLNVADNTNLTSINGLSTYTLLQVLNVSNTKITAINAVNSQLNSLTITGATLITSLDISGGTSALPEEDLDAIAVQILANGIVGTSLKVNNQTVDTPSATGSANYLAIKRTLGWPIVLFDAPATYYHPISTVSDFFEIDTYTDHNHQLQNTVTFTATYTANLIKEAITGKIDGAGFALDGIILAHDSATETVATIFSGQLAQLSNIKFTNYTSSIAGGAAEVLCGITPIMPTVCSNVTLEDCELAATMPIYAFCKTFATGELDDITFTRVNITRTGVDGDDEVALLCQAITDTADADGIIVNNCSISVEDQDVFGVCRDIESTVSLTNVSVNSLNVIVNAPAGQLNSTVCGISNTLAKPITNIKSYVNVNHTGRYNDITAGVAEIALTGSITNADFQLTCTATGSDGVVAGKISGVAGECYIKTDELSLENVWAKTTVYSPTAAMVSGVCGVFYKVKADGATTAPFTFLSKLQVQVNINALEAFGLCGVFDDDDDTNYAKGVSDVVISGSLNGTNACSGLFGYTRGLVILDHIAVLPTITGNELKKAIFAIFAAQLIKCSSTSTCVYIADAPMVGEGSPTELEPTTSGTELAVFQITEAESMQKIQYANWDFAATWQMQSGYTIPYLIAWSVVVPPLQTLTTTNANAAIVANNLSLGYVSSLYSLDYTADTVIDQTIPPGRIVLRYTYLGYTVALAYTEDTQREPSESMFSVRSEADMSTLVADHLPPGKLFDTAYLTDTIMNKIMGVVSAPFTVIEQLVADFVKEFNINTADYLLPNWEASVLLPNEITKEIVDKERRRAFVKTRFNRVGKRSLEEVQTYMREATGFDSLTITHGATGISSSLDWTNYFAITINVVAAELGSDIAMANKNKYVITSLLREVIPAHIAFTVAYPDRSPITNGAIIRTNHTISVTWTDPVLTPAPDDDIAYIELRLVGIETTGTYTVTEIVLKGVETKVFYNLQNASNYVVYVTPYYVSGFYGATVPITNSDNGTTTTNVLSNTEADTLTLDIRTTSPQISCRLV